VFARGLYLFISCDFVKIVMMKVKFHSSIVSRIMAVLFNIYYSQHQMHI